jgi:hypothetical protein
MNDDGRCEVKSWLRWLIWGGYAVLWTVMLVMPGREIVRTGVTEWSPGSWFYVTKSAHVLAYALFAFLSGFLLVPARFRWMLLFLVMIHGTITELTQLYVPELGRHGCLEDVGLNNIGVLLGVLAGWKWWTYPK